MNRTPAALLVSSILVALLVLAPAAVAKTKPASPDLVVKKVSKPPKAKTVGGKLKLVVKVANVGAAGAKKSKLGVYLGKGKKHAKKDKRLKRVKVKPLAAGKGKKLKVRITIPAKTKAGSYRLFACADDTKKVDEAKERNCKGTRKLRLEAVPTTPAPPAPAFTMSDGLDWGFVENAQDKSPEPGDPITLTLTAGNGIAGQAGYTRTAVPSEGFRTGNTTTLDFGDGEDDGQVTLQLPFAFPFGGISEQSISVSTNGWVSFGSPAWDYWDDSQPYDYRGIQTVVGELERGIMPYWADLDVGEPTKGSGSVKQVVAPDNSWVAYQWDTNEHSFAEVRRSFQLVLFRDGSFRFDYPGANTEGGHKSFVGYSLGTGAASADIVTAEGTAVPSSGQLITPKALPAVGPSATGETTALLPKGSSLVSASPGCVLTTAPAKFSTGLVTCAVPSIAAGTQIAQAVTFSMPGKAPGVSSPANFRLLGSYATGGLKLTDADEIDKLSTSLEATTIKIITKYTGGNIEAGVPTTFEVTIDTPKSSLDEPTATFSITNATLSAIEIEGEPIECTGVGGSSASCVLPSGTSGTSAVLTVIPASVNPLELTTTAKALNAPEAKLGIGIAP
ncbi:MAG TPA: CARDB domain-containing protein [Solirubrobacterales bacterium]|nr:CARDB domain-containing protein [Solirubrobacterales bacterium]